MKMEEGKGIEFNIYIYIRMFDGNNRRFAYFNKKIWSFCNKNQS